MHRVALALLVGAALLLLASHLAPLPSVLAGYLRAFAEAALIGGIADWFAVVALFRHPLGLPIPHTAIVPNNKERIGNALGEFVQRHFFNREALEGHLRSRSLADALVAKLADDDTVRSFAARVRDVLPAVFEQADAADAKALLHEELSRAVRGMAGGPLIARLLAALLDDGRREALFDSALGYGSEWLALAEPELRSRIRDRSGWIGRRLGLDERVADQVLDGAESLLEDIAADPLHPWRERYARFVEELLDDIAHGRRLTRTIDGVMGSLLDHPELASLIDELWQRAGDHLRSAAADEHSRLLQTIENALRALGDRLKADDELRERFDGWARELMVDVAFAGRGVAATLIQDTVRGWDAATIATRLETAVGRDLQFVRINGTLIGGSIGLALHAIGEFAGR